LNVILFDDATLTEAYKVSKEVARRLRIACGNFEFCDLLEEMFSVKCRHKFLMQFKQNGICNWDGACCFCGTE